MAQIISMPTRTSSASTTGATRLQIVVGRLQEAVGGLLNRAGVPGVIRPTRVHDELTGMDIEVRVSAFFTVISIDGRDFYFRRVSGEFDGTGSTTCG